MSLPSRKERRRKHNFKSQILIIAFLIILIDFLLLVSKNNSLLVFSIPFSFGYLIYLLFKNKKRLLFLNILVLIIVYSYYLEVSYRLWAKI